MVRDFNVPEMLAGDDGRLGVRKVVADLKDRHRVLTTEKLVPVQAKSTITYDTDKTFTVTAVPKGVSGNTGFQVIFTDVDSETDTDQALDVTLDGTVATVVHSTDSSGVITTTGTTLETAFNAVSGMDAVMVADKGTGSSGVVDFEGTKTLAGGIDGVTVDIGTMFLDATNNIIYIAVDDIDGTSSVAADWKKVDLSASGL